MTLQYSLIYYDDVMMSGKKFSNRHTVIQPQNILYVSSHNNLEAHFHPFFSI